MRGIAWCSRQLSSSLQAMANVTTVDLPLPPLPDGTLKTSPLAQVTAVSCSCVMPIFLSSSSGSACSSRIPYSLQLRVSQLWSKPFLLWLCTQLWTDRCSIGRSA